MKLFNTDLNFLDQFRIPLSVGLNFINWHKRIDHVFMYLYILLHILICVYCE